MTAQATLEIRKEELLRRVETLPKELSEIDISFSVYLWEINWVMALPQDQRDAAAPLIAPWRQKVEELQQQRGQILSDSLRSRGGPVKVGEAIQCRLTLQLRTPARIGDVSVRIPFVGQQAGG
jgi:hypothetical protein